MTEKKFLDTFSKYVKPDDILILAVSGGVDSMVLLDLVVKNHPKDKIIVAHFDHSLRGNESDGDSDFIEEYSMGQDICFEKAKMNIRTLAKSEKMSIESVARKYRYAFLSGIAQKYGAKYILTAHHKDDRIETAIFHLIRGTKLGGIHALSENIGLLLRPLLFISKSEILVYAEEKNIRYREDSTNTDTDYQRNYLRHEILPKFETINPEYRDALENFIGYTEELKSWIDDEVIAFLGEKNEFSSLEFAEKSPFFQREIIRYLYEFANSGTIGLTEGNIEEIRRFILTAQGGTEKKLGQMYLIKKRSTISFLSL